jgi:hypothetical protein
MVLGSRDSTSSYFLTINHVCVYVCLYAGEPPTGRVAGKVIELDLFTKLFFKVIMFNRSVHAAPAI